MYVVEIVYESVVEIFRIGIIVAIQVKAARVAISEKIIWKAAIDFATNRYTITDCCASPFDSDDAMEEVCILSGLVPGTIDNNVGFSGEVACLLSLKTRLTLR